MPLEILFPFKLWPISKDNAFVGGGAQLQMRIVIIDNLAIICFRKMEPS